MLCVYSLYTYLNIAQILLHIKYLCVHLAELASLLSRSVNYEGPALRKQVAKAQQLQQELSRRELELQSGAADMRERYFAACNQYGISVSTYIYISILQTPPFLP